MPASLPLVGHGKRVVKQHFFMVGLGVKTWPRRRANRYSFFPDRLKTLPVFPLPAFWRKTQKGSKSILASSQALCLRFKYNTAGKIFYIPGLPGKRQVMAKQFSRRAENAVFTAWKHCAWNICKVFLKKKQYNQQNYLSSEGKRAWQKIFWPRTYLHVLGNR